MEKREFEKRLSSALPSYHVQRDLNHVDDYLIFSLPCSDHIDAWVIDTIKTNRILEQYAVCVGVYLIDFSNNKTVCLKIKTFNLSV
jgi:hypothetical protein